MHLYYLVTIFTI